MKCIAVDIGATSGRVMTVTYENGIFSYREDKRFVNRIYDDGGTLRWDFPLLLDNIVSGIHEALRKDPAIRTVGIDTWAVDYGMIDSEGKLLEDPVCYRDAHSFESRKRLLEKIPFAEIYKIAGIQDLHFNTIYQLYGRKGEPNFARAKKLLLIPDLIAYCLGGEMRTEYTNLSTTSLFDPVHDEISPVLCDAIGVDRNLFPPIIHPGESYGTLSRKIFPELEHDVRILAVPTHDTASAVLGTDGFGEFAYLSSGTWSLIGTELDHPIIDERSLKANFTNELGYGKTVRFLKNTMGMFIANEIRKNFLDLEDPIEVEDIVPLVSKEKEIDVYIDPDDPSLETPGDMIHKVNAYLARTGQEKLESKGAFLKVIYQSMALNYRCALDRLTTLRGKNFDSLLIVGGGNQAVVLDQFAANATGLPVETGPIEATVLGNALCQMIALGEIPDKEEGRKHIRESISVKTYLPKERALWERKYETFRRITGK